MRIGVKRSFGWLAILVFALHAVLSGAAVPASASPLDPFSVICHSVSESAAAATPGAPHPASSACDHCALCAATGMPPLSLERIGAGQLWPSELLLVFVPAVEFARDGSAANTHQARGPPQLT